MEKLVPFLPNIDRIQTEEHLTHILMYLNKFSLYYSNKAFKFIAHAWPTYN